MDPAKQSWQLKVSVTKDGEEFSRIIHFYQMIDGTALSKASSATAELCHLPICAHLSL